jgi:hypothetical protein
VIADIARNPTPAAQKRRDLGTPSESPESGKAKTLPRMNADKRGQKKLTTKDTKDHKEALSSQ